MKKPLVSIIVPNYNAKPLIDKCINSLLKQTYDNFEIIFIDDCSKDGSYEYVREKHENDKRFRIIKNATNKGYAYNINYGFKISKGDYVCSTNIDLVFDKHWLEEMMKVMIKEKDVGIIGSGKYEEISSFKPLLLSFIHIHILKYDLEEKRREFSSVLLSGLFCINKRNLNKKGIKRPFEDFYFAYCEDEYLGLITTFSGLNNYLSKKSYFTGIDSYTKKTDKKYSQIAEFHGVKNMFLNYLVFFELKTLLKLTPYLLLLFMGSLIKNPFRIKIRIKSYFWILSNINKVIKMRMQIHKIKKRSDLDITSRFYSYKIINEEIFKFKLLKLIFRMINLFSYCYTKLVFIKTYDN